MLTINGFANLEDFGIVPLTGESCGLSYRVLCDVTTKGKAIIEKCLGCSLDLSPNWNRPNEHIGSIMLSLEMVTPIGVFALLESGCKEVWLHRDGTLLGIEQDDDEKNVTIARMYWGENLKRAFRYDGTARDRNVHVMSGRIQ